MNYKNSEKLEVEVINSFKNYKLPKDLKKTLSKVIYVIKIILWNMKLFQIKHLPYKFSKGFIEQFMEHWGLLIQVVISSEIPTMIALFTRSE